MEIQTSSLFINGNIYSGWEFKLSFAINERAVCDYKTLLLRHNALAKKPQTEERDISLFHNNAKMQKIENFLLKDPYCVFNTYSGEEIIAILKKRAQFIPCKILTQEEYYELVKGKCENV